MSFTSPYPDVDIPDSSLYRLLFSGSDTDHLDRPALVDAHSGSITTYRSLKAEVDSIAGALAARGLQLGDVVGLLALNSSAFAAVYHGVLRAGGVVTTINALYTADDIARQLKDGRARFLFADNALLPQATAAVATAGLSPGCIIAIDADDHMPSVSDLRGGRRHRLRSCRFDASSQLAVLPYSSGTTGRPKGVKLTHRNLVANLCQIESVMGITAEDTAYRRTTVLPCLRNDSNPQRRPALPGPNHHNAKVPAPDFPRRHIGIPLHLCVHRATHCRQSRQGPSGRRVRSRRV